MTNRYIEDLLLSVYLRESVIREIIATLNFGNGSRGLDAGCGIGSLTLWLAEAVGPTGHITGIDISAEHADYAKKLSQESSSAQWLTFRCGNVNKLPFQADTFDWAWSADCVAYSPQASLTALKELERVVRPGGQVAVIFWSSQQLLPGYPELEARLNATQQGIAPFTKAAEPETHPLQSMERFRKAGLSRIRARSFIGDVFAPLDKRVRNALIALLRMRWGDASQELNRNERELYERICRPDSPDFIVDSPNYYAFFTYTLFSGVVN